MISSEFPYTFNSQCFSKEGNYGDGQCGALMLLSESDLSLLIRAVGMEIKNHACNTRGLKDLLFGMIELRQNVFAREGSTTSCSE